MTKTIWLEFLTADSRAAAIEVIKRMGWDIDAEHLTEDIRSHSQTRTKICLSFWICAGSKRGNAPLFFVKMPSSTARWRTQRAEFSLYITASKKSIGKLHKKSCFGSPEIVQLFSKKFLTSGAGGGILSTEVKRGAPKGSKKILKKPLDKLRKA